MRRRGEWSGGGNETTRGRKGDGESKVQGEEKAGCEGNREGSKHDEDSRNTTKMGVMVILMLLH